MPNGPTAPPSSPARTHGTSSRGSSWPKASSSPSWFGSPSRGDSPRGPHPNRIEPPRARPVGPLGHLRRPEGFGRLRRQDVRERGESRVFGRAAEYSPHARQVAVIVQAFHVVG